MRQWLAVLVILGAGSIGYFLRPAVADAQVDSRPFAHGQQLQLTFESGRNQQSCVVTSLRGDFLGCTRERTVGSEERVIWYNLRFVERVEARNR